MVLDKNTYPYFDDYSEDKKYYQILFRPSIAVQSRELSQMQSILQNQIKRFGSAIFKEGSMTIPGELSLFTNRPYIRLKPEYSLSPIDVSNFLNKKIIGKTSGAVAEVIDVSATSGADLDTLYVSYKSGQSSQSFTGNISNGSNIITSINVTATDVLAVGSIISGSGIPSNSYIISVDSATQITISAQATASSTGVTLTSTTASAFIDGEDIETIALETEVSYSATLEDTSATGLGSIATIRSGVYFVNGHFCLVEEQTLILEKYSNTPSYSVGLRFIDKFVTEEDDVSLNDPATGSTNYNAPGAHRYYIELTLSKYELTEELPTNYIQLAVIDNGVIKSLVNRTEYSELEKTLARRTFDESGDYTVRAFPLQIKEHLDTGTNYGLYTSTNGGDESKLVYSIESGKAYVKGFEISKQSTTFLVADKPRTFTSKNNQVFNFDLGSYVNVNSVTGTFDITALDSINLYDTVDAGGSVIGTAKIRAFTFSSGTPGDMAAIYKAHIFDINITTGKFSDVRSIGTAATQKANIILDIAGDAVLYSSTKQIPLISIPEYAIKTLSDIQYTVKRYFTSTMTGTTITLTAGTNEIFSSYDVISYHMSILTASGTATGNGYSNGDVINLSDAGNSVVLGGSPTGKQVTFTVPGIADSDVEILATITKTLTAEKTKTLTSRTQSGLTHSAIVQLDKADIYDIVSIIDDSTLEDITSKYTLDNGQRDNYYDRGSLKFITGNVVPAGTISVQYRYFDHGSGDYFSADSYNGVIDYKDIPIFTGSNGKLYDLINSLDFRPRVNDTGTGFSVLSEIIIPDDNVSIDYDVYLPRKDKIYIDYKGNLFVNQGNPGTNPQLPSDLDNAMTLYEVTLNPYVFDLSDVTIKQVDNKRYTMRDIGKLDKRISNLEYYTSLSLLEKNTSDLFIDDGTGVNRFKNGFIVDNFKSHIVGDASLPEYKCAIDKDDGILRPQFKSNNVGMSYIAGSSTNITKTGDLLTLPYTITSYINQPFASKTENINPYDVFNWVGSITLSPNSDDWYETSQLPDIIIEDDDGQADALASLNGQVIWNDWVTTWVGKTLSSSSTKTSISKSTYDSLVSAGANVSTIRNWGHADSTYAAVRTTKTSEVGQTRTGSLISIVESTNSQVIDNKVVDTSLIPYIREKDITFNVKTLKPNTQVYPFFDGIGVATYVKPTAGAYGDPLITNNNGEVSGEFALPNNSSIKFRTGDKIFKLSDSSNNDSNFTTTMAEGLYSATGTLQTTQKTILSTRTANIVTSTVSEDRMSIEKTTTTTAQRTVWSDPLAQTFLIDSEGGVFLSKINIYFASKDTKGIPVTLQIRNTVNGYPGQYVVPFSEVVLNPDDITTSANGSISTSFIFDSPVYLQDGTEYCFVLLANSTEYTIWVSRIGGFDSVTGERISKQPYSGVLFKSQNASTWTADQEEDIKFEIFNCVFNTAVTGNAIFNNDYVSNTVLSNNPFYTAPDTNGTLITVIHMNHGLLTGNTVTYSGIVGTQNGIAAATLNTTHTVTVIDMDSYTIYVSDIATSVGSCGGNSIIASQNITLDVANFNVQSLSFADTVLGFAMKTRNLSDVLDTNYFDINQSENIVFTEPRIVYSQENATSADVIAKATFSTANSNISPVIDLQRSSLITVSNRINNDFTDETLARSGSALGRYITKRVALNDPATALRVYLTAIRDNTATIKVYAKYLLDENQSQDFDDQGYVEMTQVTYPAFDATTFRDYVFALENIDPFSLFAIKIVMLSSETSDAPQIKDFRAIALST